MSTKGYIKYHTNGNNSVIPIAAMDNSHIENLINLKIERMIQIKNSALYEVGDTADMFFQELNGIQKMSKSDAINIISTEMKNLEPYFTELVIRGNTAYITNISERLEHVLGRKRISNVGQMLIGDNNDD